MNKYYVLTFKEFHDVLEDTDKRVTIQFALTDEEARQLLIPTEDVDKMVKNKLIKEMKEKLGL